MTIMIWNQKLWCKTYCDVLPITHILYINSESMTRFESECLIQCWLKYWSIHHTTFSNILHDVLQAHSSSNITETNHSSSYKKPNNGSYAYKSFILIWVSTEWQSQCTCIYRMVSSKGTKAFTECLAQTWLWIIHIHQKDWTRI